MFGGYYCEGVVGFHTSALAQRFYVALVIFYLLENPLDGPFSLSGIEQQS